MTAGRIDIPVTLTEACSILHPPIDEWRLRQIIHALGWQANPPRGGRGNIATYSWNAISDLHAALLPFTQNSG